MRSPTGWVNTWHHYMLCFCKSSGYQDIVSKCGLNIESVNVWESSRCHSWRKDYVVSPTWLFLPTMPSNRKEKYNSTNSRDLDGSSWLCHLPGLLHSSDLICSFCIFFHFKIFCFVMFSDNPQNPVGFVWVFLLGVCSGYLIK